MKKKFFNILIALAGILMFYHFILFPTGILAFYWRTPSIANAPGISQGDRFMISSLATPEALDFIVFKNRDSIFGKADFVFRLIGKAGDTIHIKNGDVFRNGKNIDASLDLTRNYKVTEEQLSWMKSSGQLDEKFLLGGSRGEFVLGMKDSDTLIHHWNLKRVGLDISEPDPSIQRVYQKDWSANNFGPLVIPKNKFFVLGDYRDNSYDSRFIGLIDKENYRGKVLYIF